MNRAIAVHLGEDVRPLGLLRYDQQGARESAAFEYATAWLAAADRFAIEPGLPFVAGPPFHRQRRAGSVFHSAIADTGPDGWGRRVIQRDHAKRRQEARCAGELFNARPLNAIDYLLAVDDARRIGALRLRDEEGRYQGAPEEGRRTTPPLIELAQLLSATRAVETNTRRRSGATAPRCEPTSRFHGTELGPFSRKSKAPSPAGGWTVEPWA